MMEELFTNTHVFKISATLAISFVVSLIVVLAVCFWQFKQIMRVKSLLKSHLAHNQAHELENNKTGLVESVSLLLKINQQQPQAETSEIAEVITEKKVIAFQYKKMQAVLEVFPEGVVILDDAGMVTFANIKLESLLGISQSQLIRRMPHEWCTDRKVLDLLARYNTNVTHLRRAEVIEYIPEDKPDKTISVSAVPLTLPANNEVIVGVLVTFRDVSAEALARRSRDDFVAHVSHELKSPLNVIKMQGELLLSDGDDPQTRVMSINVINDEVERLSTMVNDLLNITRLEVGSISIDRQRTRFHDFLTDIFENVKRQASDEDIKFDLNLPAKLSHIDIDKDLFRIAVNNILSNAIKYNRPGGLVSLNVEEAEDAITIAVSDTGIGISPEDQKKIFEKFYRSDDDQVTDCNGHGLGLSLAQEIISLHNGRLSVESEQGNGTTFKIEILKTSTLLKEAG